MGYHLMRNSSAKIWLIVILFLAAFILGGSSFLNKTLNKFAPSPLAPSLNQTQLSPGLSKIQKMIEAYPKLVKGTVIQQQIEGILKASALNSWTLEQDGQTITLNQEGAGTIHLFKLPKITTNSAKLSVPVEIKAKDIQIGDRVSVYQTIDYQTGKTTITGITVLAKD